MQIAGLLVEYLIIGSFSAIWIIALFLGGPFQLPELDSPAIYALCIPVLYVLGMLSDFLGSKALSRKKDAIQASVGIKEITPDKKQANRKWSYHRLVADLILNSPELFKQLEMRSTRDRISRGVLINMLPILIVLVLLSSWSQSNVAIKIITSITIVSTVGFVIYKMWARYELISAKMEYQIAQALAHKEGKEEYPFH